MFVIGIDLSGPSNAGETSAVAFAASAEGDLSACGSLQGADDKDILSFAESLPSGADLVVGIDAPLSYNIGGGDRPADAELRRKVTAAGLRPGSVMTPTMTRMVYLTLRGIAVARLLQFLNNNAKIVEVHPGAALALRGASAKDIMSFKRNEESRKRLLAWLEKQGLKKAADISAPSDHYVAACAGVLAAWKWHHHNPVWLYPATPPFHPFDYAC